MILKGSSQKELRQRLAEFVRSRTIDNFLIRAETTEGLPVDGFKTHTKTGRYFLELEVRDKP